MKLAVTDFLKGSMMRFTKRQLTVSIKRLVMNFEMLLREVRLGRAIQITSRNGVGGMLTPIGAKQRVSRKRRPMKQVTWPNKPARRW